jgi:hypothetical protein
MSCMKDLFIDLLECKEKGYDDRTIALLTGLPLESVPILVTQADALSKVSQNDTSS